MMRIVAQILVLTLLASHSSADTVQDGRNGCLIVEDLRPDMSDQQLVSVGKCVGMADGVVQVMIYNCIHASDAPVPKASAPPSIGATIQAFLNWSDAHPELWGESFSNGMMAAAMETFPCEN